MGQPHAAVTDSFGRVHGVPWLRIADASLFPDALEINPYFSPLDAPIARQTLDELNAVDSSETSG